MASKSTTRAPARRLAAGALAAAMLLGAAAPALALDPKVSDLDSTDPTTQLQMKAFVSGAWNELLVADVYLQEKKQGRLICPGDSYAPSDDELVSLVKGFVLAHPQVKAKDYEISIVAFFAFQQFFPCPK